MICCSSLTSADLQALSGDVMRPMEECVYFTHCTHCTHTLYSYTMLIHYAHTLYSHTMPIHYAHTLCHYIHTLFSANPSVVASVQAVVDGASGEGGDSVDSR
jgi:hypothetical protein